MVSVVRLACSSLWPYSMPIDVWKDTSSRVTRSSVFGSSNLRILTSRQRPHGEASQTKQYILQSMVLKFNEKQARKFRDPISAHTFFSACSSFSRLQVCGPREAKKSRRVWNMMDLPHGLTASICEKVPWKKISHISSSAGFPLRPTGESYSQANGKLANFRKASRQHWSRNVHLLQ